tara:strand:+ start:63 stop:803 length:741 start_codon:yes stop_codon:yes gene_type:complete
MKAVKYIRVSTVEQNIDRQQERGVKEYIDKCSGSIPFKNRPAAKKLINDIAIQQENINLPPSKRISIVKIASISRIGRNLQDILDTVDFLTHLGVCIVSEKEGIRTLDDEGKENPTAKMVLGIMATLSEYERELILERQKEGIIAAKKRGAYENGGRPKLSPQEFITKPKNAKVLALLLKGVSIRETAFRCQVSNGTVQKVSKIGKELGYFESHYNLQEDYIKISKGNPNHFDMPSSKDFHETMKK